MKDRQTQVLISRRRAIGGLFASAVAAPLAFAQAASAERPNIVLVMADDQGWGDVGFRNPALKTPVMDELARTALHFERFYAAAPVCSPTRASVLTGRHPNRSGCFSWGHTIRPQEITIAEALKTAGYTTGHFGKWHVGPVRDDSPVNPGQSGFDRWLSAPNFYDNNPLMSDEGKVRRIPGESSQIAVDAAVGFIRGAVQRKQPFLAVVWFGSPHAPHSAAPEDRALYADQPERVRDFYGEITGMDRALGNLRAELRKLGIAANTLLWYKSDNGALPVGSAGGLSGNKSELLEGGIRVPSMIEWPARITQPRTVRIPCGTVDVYPTLVELAGAKVPKQVQPLDGVSLVPLIEGRMGRRDKALGFWVFPQPGIRTPSEEFLEQLRKEQAGQAPQSPPSPNPGENIKQWPEDELAGPSAWIDGDYKLHRIPARDGSVAYRLYHLVRDPAEKTDLAGQETQRVASMKAALEAWQRSVLRSLNGKDYS